MPILKTDVISMARWLSLSKERGDRIVWFVGARTSGLFRNQRLYDLVQSRSGQQLSASNDLEKFSECYDILSQSGQEEAYNIIKNSLREQAMDAFTCRCLAILMKEGFAHVIVTTNLDNSLEEALQREGVQVGQDYYLFASGAHSSAADIDRLVASPRALVKIFGNVTNQHCRTPAHEFELRANKNLRGYLEDVLSSGMLLVAGYDKNWDFPLEKTFLSGKAGNFFYVNEEEPADELLLTRVLRAQKGYYLPLSLEKRFGDFVDILYKELNKNRSTQAKSEEDSPDSSSKGTGDRDRPIPESGSPSDKTDIFISYSHEDAIYMRRLKVFLKDFSRQGLINDWDDTRIPVGEKWLEEIIGALRRAKVAVLLLSADFFASDFITERELPALLKGAEAGEIKLILIVISYCDFQHSPLASYQTINPPSQPLKSMSEVDQDKVWEKVKHQIRG